ncbi:hypothetical protein C4K14_2177 [Pseudomonas chlororaphis subsp. aureofaciens]|uniref:hypothetical protein n=1 Tax=Pseudomonas chlororaphis TaxID=587753 RepID=UPI000F570D2B|nr:hypothetical protein [Pseudomonas chlororaphis]AZD85011.1 hypothetical protein C4K14_2177 [Pseudomonas chlororaphis subsp. aureofaciens]
MAELIKPKTVQIKDVDGNLHTFVISRLPAVDSREILAKYPVSNIPKLGEYQASVEAMRLLMSYVAVPLDHGDQRLVTRELIDNHVPDGEALLRLEFAMLEYNTSFFGNGGPSTFFDGLVKKHLPLVIQTLMASLPQSLVRDLRAGPNSKPQ